MEDDSDRTMISIYIDSKLNRVLREMAYRLDINKSTIINEALMQYLTKLEESNFDEDWSLLLILFSCLKVEIKL